MKEIRISKELSDYIERLNYEARAYRDLLDSVSKEYMTEEEWNESWEYFSNLSLEADISKKIAFEVLQEIYQEEMKNCCHWYIDFNKNTIILNDRFKEFATNRVEQFSEFLNRLYPNNLEEIKINSTHVKMVTLQVTDACNMACTYCY